MKTTGDRLSSHVQQYQAATGEHSLMVAIERHDQELSIQQVAFDKDVGLLVDGKTPTGQWHQEAEDFHPLQLGPTVLH